MCCLMGWGGNDWHMGEIVLGVKGVSPKKTFFLFPPEKKNDFNLTSLKICEPAVDAIQNPPKSQELPALQDFYTYSIYYI